MEMAKREFETPINSGTFVSFGGKVDGFMVIDIKCTPSTQGTIATFELAMLSQLKARDRN
jgi:hypothetical protein